MKTLGVALSLSCLAAAHAVAAETRFERTLRSLAPSARLEPRGGQKAAWPVIHRWTYPAFTVYFERDKVIDAVQNPLPGEPGPVPVPTR